MEEIKLNLLLLGKTGQGKSATGNTLLDRPGFFKTSANLTSQTKDVKCSFRHFGSYMLQVVDGPGLEDSDMDAVEDKESAIRNMETATAMCYGGIDVFLLVIKFGSRFTAEDRSALESLKTIFGEDFFKHVVIVVTGGDLFRIEMENELSFHEWCCKQVGPFSELYNDCRKRAVLINNREKDSEKQLEQIQEIILHAHNLQEKNGRYTSQCFQLAEKAREKMILDLKLPQLKKDFQEKINLLAARLKKYSESPESEKKGIQASIEDLRKEIKEQDKGYGVLKDMDKLAEGLVEDFNNRVKLQAVTEKADSCTIL